MNLLRAVASPCDEVGLAGVLRSPMFGLLDETLYWLSRHEGGLCSGFWDAWERSRYSAAPPACTDSTPTMQASRPATGLVPTRSAPSSKSAYAPQPKH